MFLIGGFLGTIVGGLHKRISLSEGLDQLTTEQKQELCNEVRAELRGISWKTGGQLIDVVMRNHPIKKAVANVLITFIEKASK